MRRLLRKILGRFGLARNKEKKTAACEMTKAILKEWADQVYTDVDRMLSVFEEPAKAKSEDDPEFTRLSDEALTHLKQCKKCGLLSLKGELFQLPDSERIHRASRLSSLKRQALLDMIEVNEETPARRFCRIFGNRGK